MNYKEKFLKSINKIAEKEIDKVNINQHYLEVLESQDKEIERLNNKVEELLTLYTTEREVKEDYKSIIKEVGEYAKDNQFTALLDIPTNKVKKIENGEMTDILEILDKAGDEK